MVLISCEHISKLPRRVELIVFGGAELPLLFTPVSWGI